ncbi:cyclin-dependent protein kinase complex component [Blastomyces gilchristii SLH14081]|uniref:Cyclin-dependent protein kinase complex component n=1 Tax=Blastomyces gilchristii (strain SLH14081) TaxID=559298 RepID=A0A179V3G1_BLAGS|nr:cyclin-dependent protein kinase complex component [Blastomyces gilchristii SLH14081]OAT13968.1 cyclin-dependent protein kinase complex component [Blastomyces gilchristii SLH14081]
MTSLPNPHRFPDRHRSAYRQHSPQHNQGFDHAGIPLSNTRCGLDSDNPSSHSSPRLQPTYRSSLSLGGSEATSPSRIQVHDLSHIRSFANEEVLASSRRLQTQGSNGRSQQDVGRQYEISSMPVTDIIEMVAGLLTKITTTNDQQHEHIHRNIPPTDGAGGISAQTTSVLAFHGKNVPSITILSYLSRIHKYCPTTYEVFLSLLVYFDRMTEMVNKAFIQSLQQRSDQHSSSLAPHSSPSTSIPSGVTPNRPSTRGSIATPPSSVQMRARDNDPSSPSPPSTIYQEFIPPSSSTTPAAYEDAYSLSHYFVVDSFNIHRLVIAGVTCASKFFSDVFYTNSRYAKVGGLPLLELNHLELQFLLLNDFRLAIPVEELEAYGTMLVEFYAREVVAQQQQQLPQQPQNPGDGQDHPFSTTGHRAKDGAYMEQRPSQREGIIQANVSQTPTPP